MGLRIIDSFLELRLVVKCCLIVLISKRAVIRSNRTSAASLASMFMKFSIWKNDLIKSLNCVGKIERMTNEAL